VQHAYTERFARSLEHGVGGPRNTMHPRCASTAANRPRRCLRLFPMYVLFGFYRELSKIGSSFITITPFITGCKYSKYLHYTRRFIPEKLFLISARVLCAPRCLSFTSRREQNLTHARRTFTLYTRVVVLPRERRYDPCALVQTIPWRVHNS